MYLDRTVLKNVSFLCVKKLGGVRKCHSSGAIAPLLSVSEHVELSL
jgi:hypothetical protein